MKTENDPELIKIAGELYHGVISHPTVEYFGEVYKLVTVGAKKTGNPLAQFDFGVSLPTWFGDLTIPSQLKARVYDILRKTPKDHVQALPSTPDQLSPAQITTLSWSGDIYEVNTRLMEYYSVFGDIGNPDNRFPFHVILEEPFGKDILQALILVADESAYNYRIPFSCEFEKEVRKVKDWHPEAF